MVPASFLHLDQVSEITELVQSIRKQQFISPLGLIRSARLPVLVEIFKQIKKPLLFIVAHIDQLNELQDEFLFWLPDANSMTFSEPSSLFYEKIPWSDSTRLDRIKVLTALASSLKPVKSSALSSPFIFTTVKALMTPTLPRRQFLKHSWEIQQGQSISMEKLLQKCMYIGYERMEIVTAPGQVSHRGGIVDIWPASLTQPVRIDFFGDEVDSIRQFDPQTQRSVEKLQQVSMAPVREILMGDILKPNSSFNDETLEFRLPEIYPNPSSLLDYLPDGSLVVLDDGDYLQSVSTEIEQQSLALQTDLIKSNSITENFPTPYLSWSELSDANNRLAWLDLGFASTPQSYGLARRFSVPGRFGGKLEEFITSIRRSLWKNEEVVIVSRQSQRLKDLWDEQFSGEHISKSPIMLDGSLNQGFEFTYPDERIFYLYSDNEIFGWVRPQPRRKTKLKVESPEFSYSDLRVNDWVVHVDNGIGRFVGLVKRNLEGVDREFLCVEFADNAQLFVPVHQADRLSLYIGPNERPPRPTRLGTAEWQLTRARVHNAVRQVAWDFLELYARRKVAKGFAFKPDTAWQKELEASFPYTETTDQVQAIAEVKRDMEVPRPMDRLLCGDVGYGKTEVALRASFKAILDGKQVAMLVPTTILAQQHFETFQQRLAVFPVNLAMLSRFKSQAEQSGIIQRLANGQVDIVIGTHRLLQADVKFKDMGLLVIDEEQRFGVIHKEHFKKLRTEVDVLTLTATPIPRTLYMALSGVRDISVINSPPSDRLPITTFVGSYNVDMIRRAILRELDRHGQVFFVHNRVQTIEGAARQLRQMVPEARLAVAHGQMPEDQLASVMQHFSHGEIDVLCSTSIIESGLDIPNANTLIVDRADRFGLAELYQLRGRVGRGIHRAYAYFFFHPQKAPTIEGRERLEIIAEHTQLGAGYSIAMRDLEMRGAGDLLGTLQHGHIAAVGFHLYTRLLSQAVKELRMKHGMEEEVGAQLPFKEIKPLVVVELPLSMSIPLDYVQNQEVRLQLYRRLADIQNEEEVQLLMEEFTDRFGPMVDEVANLFFQLKIKILAEEAGLLSITVENNQIVMRYPPQLANEKSRETTFLGENIRSGKNAYWMPFDKMDKHWREQLIVALRRLVELKHI
jgi:transcription-repair coupling factor (superfamily II helicase)